MSKKQYTFLLMTVAVCSVLGSSVLGHFLFAPGVTAAEATSSGKVIEADTIKATRYLLLDRNGKKRAELAEALVPELVPLGPEGPGQRTGLKDKSVVLLAFFDENGKRTTLLSTEGLSLYDADGIQQVALLFERALVLYRPHLFAVLEVGAEGDTQAILYDNGLNLTDGKSKLRLCLNKAAGLCLLDKSGKMQVQLHEKGLTLPDSDSDETEKAAKHTCPQCGQDVAPKDERCPHCGFDLSGD
jgi:hypothetical protein